MQYRAHRHLVYVLWSIASFIANCIALMLQTATTEKIQFTLVRCLTQLTLNSLYAQFFVCSSNWFFFCSTIFKRFYGFLFGNEMETQNMMELIWMQYFSQKEKNCMKRPENALFKWNKDEIESIKYAFIHTKVCQSQKCLCSSIFEQILLFFYLE